MCLEEEEVVVYRSLEGGPVEAVGLVGPGSVTGREVWLVGGGGEVWLVGGGGEVGSGGDTEIGVDNYKRQKFKMEREMYSPEEVGANTVLLTMLDFELLMHTH